MNDKETLVPFKICSFDIEASSAHGDFPLPKKNYKKLATNIVDYCKNHKIDDHILHSLLACAFGFENTYKHVIDPIYIKNASTFSKEEFDKVFQIWITTIIDKKVETDDECQEDITQYLLDDDEHMDEQDSYTSSYSSKKENICNGI